MKVDGPHRGTWFWSILLIFVTVVILSLFWLLLPGSWQANENSDYQFFYAPVARSLLDGDGLERLDGSAATQYPPGFPVILAALFGLSDNTPFSESSLLNLFTIISMIVSALLLFSIGQTLYPPIFAFVAVLLWLTYPFALWALKQPNSEIAFLPFFLGSAALFWYSVGREENSYGRFLAIGILVGLAMLIRPAAIGLGFVLIFLLAIWRRRKGIRAWLFPGFMILLGNVIVILPWLTWLYQQTGQITLLSTNGPASIRDGLTFAVNLKGYREAMIIQPDIEQVMQTFLKQAPTFDSLGALIQAFWSTLIASPFAVIKLMLWKAMRSWYGTDSHRLELPTLLIQLVYLVFISFGAGIAWRRKGRSKQVAQMILLVTFYFWAMTVLVLSILRYMIPVMALLMLFVPFLLLLTPLRRLLHTGESE